MASIIQLRRDTEANWTAADPILAEGEVGFETDTGRLKVGNGLDAWSALSYFSAAGAVAWGAITGTLSAQTDLQAALDDKANAADLAAVATSGDASDVTYDNAGSGLTATNVQGAIDELAAAPPGAGDVVGPASAVDDRIATFDGATGKLIQDGGKTIAQVESSAAAAARTPNVQSVTSAATVTPTFANDLVKITAQAAALTLANPSGTAVDGWGIVIRVKDNGTARAITYGSQYRAIGVTLPATTVIGKTVYLAGIWNVEDTTLDIVAVGP